MNFNDLTKSYAPEGLRRQDLKDHPHDQLLQWFEEAIKGNVEEVNAMSLATATTDGKPSCRTVLLKQLDKRGLVFYTNYESRKSKELMENPYAMATFYWPEQMRQICIEGQVEKISGEASGTYFGTRPRGNQIGAWASRQDQIIASREILEKQFAKMEEKFQDQEVPRPSFWGGFRLIPTRYEFWQGGKDRLHNRFQYTQEHDTWKIERLYP
ncbi:MAG: pyridoxamine 5'-phosphate oxidase [Waddliaceae bacterium]